MAGSSAQDHNPRRFARSAGEARRWLLAIGAATLAFAPTSASISQEITITQQTSATQLIMRALTLDNALKFASEMRRAQRDADIVVSLPPGTLRLTRPVTIGREASRPDDGTLTIKGAGGGRTRIAGSAQLGLPMLETPVALLERLPPASRDHVRAYRLPPDAATPYRIQAPRSLRQRSTDVAFEVFDEKGPLWPARWPNAGWSEISGGDGSTFRSAIERARLNGWTRENDLWAEGYWRWGWLFESLPVGAVEMASGGISLETSPYEGFAPGARYRISHALSELDEPGEWWRDRDLGLLLVWPRGDVAALKISVAKTLIEVDGASNVRLDQLLLEEARGDLVVVKNASGVSITRSVLRRAGGRAVNIVSSVNSGVERSDIAETGAGGVWLAGGNRDELIPGMLFVRDCRVTNYARLARTQTPAITLEGVGQEIVGNYIHDADAYALHLRGNEHRIAWNEFARLLMESTDTGAIYAGRDWTARGNVIEHNFLHDIRAAPNSEVKGIYLDDMTSGFTIRGNVFLRVDQPVFIGGGRDNTVSDNRFFKSSPGVHIDSRGRTWASSSIADPESELRAALSAVPVRSAPWLGRYPELSTILQDEPADAKRNAIVGNVWVDSIALRFTEEVDPQLQIIKGNRGPDGLRYVIKDLDVPKVFDKNDVTLVLPSNRRMQRSTILIPTPVE